jgi:chorismate mutase
VNTSSKSHPSHPKIPRKDSQRPFLISGPCGVESLEQILQAAQEVSQLPGIQYLRGGIWKPRTRPDSFEGVGEIGLEWMVEARNQTGLRIITEVARASHVEACLKHNFDAIWLGARTTVNPFSVQEIADALRGVQVPVFIKNPMVPDLALWLGAVERIMKSGIEQIAVIHRGFSHYGDSIYRYKPMWEIPIAFRTRMPEIPMLCDPSHIAGEVALIPSLAQKAMDLGMEGLMIEVHPNPQQALSDKAQQFTLQDIHALLSILEIRNNNSQDEVFVSGLIALRSRIDKVDEEIIHLLGKRMRIAEELGEYKKKHGVNILQLERWKEILATRGLLAERVGLTEEFTSKYLDQIHKESIRHQTKVMNSNDASTR